VPTYLIYQADPFGEQQPQNMPGTEVKTVTLTPTFWGLRRQDLPVVNCRLSNGQRIGIEEVRVERTFLHMLITLITLGFMAPARVSWRCCRPPSQTGTLD
jgi:hypothetical protein